ncbi:MULTISPECIES: hypothetical protein [Alcaligenaceae]|nr:hypothetical protein [Bordetella genomosp. 10]
MKKLIALVAVACSLSGCIVVPADGGHYYHRGGYRYYPAPAHYYYGY